jgi:hypothetical protein
MTQRYLREKTFARARVSPNVANSKCSKTRKQNINTMNAISVEAETNEKAKKAKLENADFQ